MHNNLHIQEIKLPDFGMPEALEIEPTQDCNFRCVMCHVSHMTLSRESIDVSFLKNMPRLKGLHVRLGSAYEPMMHPHFDAIVNGLSALGMKISLTTNGSLLTDALIDAIKDANFHQVTFSFDSADKTHYEKIRRHANYERVVERFCRFKESVLKQDVYFSINMTVVKENMEDILSTIEFAEKHRFNSLGIIAGVQRGDDLLTQEDFIYQDLERYERLVLEAADEVIRRQYAITLGSVVIRKAQLEKKYPRNIKDGRVVQNQSVPNPPNYIEACQRGEIEGMRVACKSPFTFAKILYNGAVQLCNRFYIGNIHHQRFEDIWFSKEANFVRKKIMADSTICQSCEFFKFCINANHIQYDDPKSQKINTPPIQILTKAEAVHVEGNYKIYRWLDDYYAVDKDDSIDYKQRSYLLDTRALSKNSTLESLITSLQGELQ